MSTFGKDFSSNPMAISANGNYFSIASLDGQIDIWDTVSSELVSQYTHSKHLSATCVRLSWPPIRKTKTTNFNSPEKRTKRIRSTENDLFDEIEKLSLVAIGTADGTILLFSTTLNQLHTKLIEHTDCVNDVSWCPINDSLFSCSNDHFVIEWSILDSKVKCKAKLTDSVISSICAIDNENILTASNNIKWWNWPRKELLQTFNGHSNDVKYLKPILFNDLPSLNGECNDFYFLSSANSDRYINAWKLAQSSSKNPVANFSLDDEPISLEVAYTSLSNIVYLLSVSRSGSLYIFEHNFSTRKPNGVNMNIPVVPKIRLQIQIPIKVKGGERKQKLTTNKSIPFLFAHLNVNLLPNSSSSSPINKTMKNFFLLLGYGDVNRPTFERLSYGECEKCYLNDNGVLMRDQQQVYSITNQLKLSVVNETNHTKIKTSKSNDRTTVIGPAGIISAPPLFNNIHSNGNVSNGDLLSEDEIDNEDDKSINPSNEDINNNLNNETTNNDNELTLDEKLKLIDEKISNKNVLNKKISNTQIIKSKITKSKCKISKEKSATDSLVNVLMQGLQSNDTNMLNTVLNTMDQMVIDNTVKKLPVEYVPSLLLLLQKGLFHNSSQQTVYLKWITTVIHNKISYLMTMPNISKEFLSLSQLLSSRTSMLDRCYQLKGKLDLMLSQVKKDRRTEKLTRTVSKLNYESDSSTSDEDNDDSDAEMNDLEQDDVDQMSVDDKDLFNDSEDDDDEEEEEDESDDHEDDEEDGPYDSANDESDQSDIVTKNTSSKTVS